MVAGQAQRKDCHTIDGTPTMILACNIQKLFARQSQFSPVGTEVPINQIKTKGIVPCWDRGMSGEQRVCYYSFTSFVKAQTGSNELSAAFQIQECRVALVQVPGGRSDA